MLFVWINKYLVELTYLFDSPPLHLVESINIFLKQQLFFSM